MSLPISDIFIRSILRSLVVFCQVFSNKFTMAIFFYKNFLHFSFEDFFSLPQKVFRIISPIGLSSYFEAFKYGDYFK